MLLVKQMLYGEYRMEERIQERIEEIIEGMKKGRIYKIKKEEGID